jgi:hypothetical protein
MLHFPKIHRYNNQVCLSGSVKTARGWTAIVVNQETGEIAYQVGLNSAQRGVAEKQMAAALMGMEGMSRAGGMNVRAG